MKIINIFETHPNAQIVLSFSNNNDVVITSDCFEENSKFIRQSKIRMEVEFSYIGCFTDNHFQVTEFDLLDPLKDTVLMYRTFNGENLQDYVVYVSNEYRYIEHIKKCVGYKRAIETLTHYSYNNKQLPEKVLDIKPCVFEGTYYTSYRSKLFETGHYRGKLYDNNAPKDLHGYYQAVLSGLVVAKKYPDKINKVRVFCPPEAKAVYMLPLRKWKPLDAYALEYVNKINMLKKELSNLGISIVFMECQ